MFLKKNSTITFKNEKDAINTELDELKNENVALNEELDKLKNENKALKEQININLEEVRTIIDELKGLINNA